MREGISGRNGRRGAVGAEEIGRAAGASASACQLRVTRRVWARRTLALWSRGASPGDWRCSEECTSKPALALARGVTRSWHALALAPAARPISSPPKKERARHNWPGLSGGFKLYCPISYRRSHLRRLQVRLLLVEHCP
jgi:hypothetical protein